MASTAPAFFPTSTPPPPPPRTLLLLRNSKNHHHHLNYIHHARSFCNSHPVVHTDQRRHCSALHVQHAFASAAASSYPLNVDYLATEFGGHGVSFESIGDSCVVKMRLENGSLAHLMLPSGLVTSYRPFMWHGTTEEVLHTTVTEGTGGQTVIQGGVSMEFRCKSDDDSGGGVSWSPATWALGDVRGGPRDYIQVELVSREAENRVAVKCILTLHPNVLTSEFKITNTDSSSSVCLSASVINHLTVSTPDATYAVGLQGSNYRGRKPVVSQFSIVPPQSKLMSFGQQLANKGFDALLTGWGSTSNNRSEAIEQDFSTGDESEGEEDDDQAHMTEEFCRVYTNAPRKLTFIDRGKRNSIAIGRSGFDELYLFSPGSNHEWYGKYAFICIGSSMLKPVLLGPGGVWEGAQYVHNPNV